MDNTFKDLIKEIDDEIVGERDLLIQKSIDKQLKKFEFNENNVSSSLISLLMTKASTKVPLPEHSEIPAGVEGRAAEIEGFVSDKVADIYMDLRVKNNVYLYGKAGTGKTTLAKNIAKYLLLQEVETVNCNQFTSPIDLKGGQTIEGYKQGSLSKAWKNGYVLILDELPKLDPNTAGILNEALAQSADKEKTFYVEEAEYRKYEAEFVMAELEEKELDHVIVEEVIDGTTMYKRTNFITMTDGNGDKIKKHENFVVIATGNTDMKEISANFSGNNRQDYSLVDRFVGGFYEIGFDTVLEERLIYKKVLEVARAIRDVLEKADALESVSLRTMLNFNRIYEQEGLRKIGYKTITVEENGVPRKIIKHISPYVVEPLVINSQIKAKTLGESVASFVQTLPAAKKTDQTILSALESSRMDIDKWEFMLEFMIKHKYHPITELPVSEADIAAFEEEHRNNP
jgi:adenylate kinase family enzyme